MLPQIQYDNMILLLGKNNVVERYAKEMLNIDLFRKWGDIMIIAKELFDISTKQGMVSTERKRVSFMYLLLQKLHLRYVKGRLWGTEKRY